VVEQLIPSAWQHVEQYANNRIESDHSQLKHRLRPMRGVCTDRTAQVIIAGHAFIQNLRRGHYELGLDVPPEVHALTEVPAFLAHVPDRERAERYARVVLDRIAATPMFQAVPKEGERAVAADRSADRWSQGFKASGCGVLRRKPALRSTAVTVSPVASHGHQ
jgi:hypothetical protein